MDQELEQVSEIYNMIVTYLVTYSFQILGAIIILVIATIIGRKVGELVLGLCQKKDLDITLSRFFASCTRIAIIGSGVVIALPKLGIQITPFVAAIGALGLGAGLAVQGLLSNYGAGLSIIVTRLFVVGDTIRIQGVWGVVEEVHLSHTLLTNEDGEVITIPNKHIVGEIIHNSQADAVLELSVGIAYDSDPKLAVSAIRERIAGIEGISEARKPQVGIDGFGDSSIDIGIRCWAKTERFHEVRFQCNMAVHEVLAENHIQIPFPQREVRMLNGEDLAAT